MVDLHIKYGTHTHVPLFQGQQLHKLEHVGDVESNVRWSIARGAQHQPRQPHLELRTREEREGRGGRTEEGGQEYKVQKVQSLCKKYDVHRPLHTTAQHSTASMAHSNLSGFHPSQGVELAHEPSKVLSSLPLLVQGQQLGQELEALNDGRASCLGRASQQDKGDNICGIERSGRGEGRGELTIEEYMHLAGFLSGGDSNSWLHRLCGFAHTFATFSPSNTFCKVNFVPLDYVSKKHCLHQPPKQITVVRSERGREMKEENGHRQSKRKRERAKEEKGGNTLTMKEKLHKHVRQLTHTARGFARLQHGHHRSTGCAVQHRTEQSKEVSKKGPQEATLLHLGELYQRNALSHSVLGDLLRKGFLATNLDQFEEVCPAELHHGVASEGHNAAEILAAFRGTHLEDGQEERHDAGEGALEAASGVKSSRTSEGREVEVEEVDHEVGDGNLRVMGAHLLLEGGVNEQGHIPELETIFDLIWNVGMEQGFGVLGLEWISPRKLDDAFQDRLRDVGVEREKDWLVPDHHGVQPAIGQ